MPEPLPDYFAPAPTAEAAALRRVKGSTRREMISLALERGDPLDSVPEDWLSHELPDYLKRLLQRRHPSHRGGEDLPDLRKGEVEIARITLVDAVHGEVISLRARRSRAAIGLSLVDEYETEYALPRKTVRQPLTAEEALQLLAAADPSPLSGTCQLRLDSDFYPDLDALADLLKVKKVHPVEEVEWDD